MKALDAAQLAFFMKQTPEVRAILEAIFRNPEALEAINAIWCPRCREAQSPPGSRCWCDYDSGLCSGPIRYPEE